MTDELLRAIERAKREGWTKLILSDMNLMSLPVAIGQLTHLKQLDINRNQLTMLPTVLSQLVQLKELYVRDNYLTVLPNGLGQLKRLEILAVSGNKLTALPSELSQLTKLQALDISRNQLSTLPVELNQLGQLLSLNARGNKLTSLPAELGQLKRLITLNLNDNRLTSLPAELGQLRQLRSLNIHRNELTTLSADVGKFTELQVLDVSSNQLTSLPAELGQLNQLEELDVSNNKLIELPAWAWHLPNLKTLDVRGNELPVPPEALHSGDVSNTRPLAQPLLREYANIMRSGKPLNEARLIVIGEARAGKTNLVRRLLGEPFDQNSSLTHGIFIRKLGVSSDLGEIAVNIWDFGGQRIYRATHQFFFSERAVYVLVLNASQNEEQNRVEHWLNLIASYGKGARVILAINHSDEHTLNLDERRYKLAHGHIAGDFIHTSAKTDLGLTELRQAIEDEVRDLRHVHTRLYDRHLAIKRRLASKNKSYVSREQFAEYCDEAGVTGEEPQAWLLRLLNDLGSAISFDDPNVAGKFVLNPEWVTRGVYAALERTPGARVRLSDVRAVLDPRDYPGDTPSYILNLMRKFELCYPLDEGADSRFLLLDKLPDNTPAEVENWERDPDALRLEYEYAALPASVITRVIVRLHMFVRDEPWRSGAFLRSVDGRNEALIRSDGVTQRTFFAVRGHEATRRDFFAAIRTQFEHVHATVNLTPTAFVPLPAHVLKPEHRDIKITPIPYEKLLRYEQNGRPSIYVDEINEDILVRALLDGVRVEVTTRALCEVLSKRFGLEELMTLCSDLGFDHENVFGKHDTKDLIAQKVVAHLNRRDELDALLRYVRRERPGAI